MPRVLLALLLVLMLPACAPESAEPVASAKTASPANSAPPANLETLETPYTAEQIRDAWVEGLSLKMVNETSHGKQYQRWTVVAADAEGADIAYQEIDAEGQPIGDPRVQRSLWVELRDHARFPAANCSRTEVTRQTPLGELTGWSYVLRDSSGTIETDFFFAHDLPGAPVTMVVTQGGVVQQEMTQEAREVQPRG